MTGSTSSDPAARVPGVYPAARPRVPQPAGGRTDVAGFVGFEPRVRVAGASADLRVRVARFLLRDGPVAGWVGAEVVALSADPDPVAANESRTFALVAVAVPKTPGAVVLRVVPGRRAAPDTVLAPGDDEIAAVLVNEFPAESVAAGMRASVKWVRVADVVARRPAGSPVRLRVRPALPPVPCHDREDFRLAFGDDPGDGTMLAPAVRAFFANGGKRCHVVTATRPDFDDEDGRADAAADLIGVRGAAEGEATGLERLLRIEEVSLIDVPDLHARRVGVRPPKPLLPPGTEARFACCDATRGAAVAVSDRPEALGPVFDAGQVTDAQCALLRRVTDERWRALLLLAPPLDQVGRDVLPTSPDAVGTWRDRLMAVGDSPELSAAALYYPWVLAQETVGGPVTALPPTGHAAGVMAKRDVARGPHVAAANETLVGVVGTTWELTDPVHGELYIPDPAAVPPRGGVNLIRPFPGRGVQLWGARTLSPDPWLRYLTVRRGLSAVQRRVKAALEAVAFEPHTPLLWLVVTQAVVGVLMPLFDAGAFRGPSPAESFYVRCDAGTNPADAVADGRLTCEVGVAVAAPAEFVVFRLTRRDGAVELAG